MIAPTPINLHAFPGRGKAGIAPDRNRLRPAERLHEHNGLVLVGTAEVGVLPERWGLGMGLSFVGRSATAIALVVDDGLEDRDPGTHDDLCEWAQGEVVTNPAGPRSVEVITRRSFLDPDEGLFTKRCYLGAGWCLTADEGRSLGLLSDHYWPARGDHYAGGFGLGLAGWGEIVEGRRGTEWRALPHRPPLYAKALGGHGLLAGFGRAGRGGIDPDGKPAGRWEKGRPFSGRLVDLIAPAYAYDGLDTSGLSAHGAEFGVSVEDGPPAVAVDVASAGQLLSIARGIHALAVVLDEEAAGWFTSPDDRRCGRSVVGLRFAVSPGSLATAARRRSGLTSPLAKFAVPDDEALDRWAGATHGGWVS
jgi:hypothetical protein